MNKASIVSIGNELLNGQQVDTNAPYLSGKLFTIGLPVISCYTVGDDVEKIVHVLKLAVADADVVLITGGLGPTDDDLTRQALAEFLKTELQLQNDLLEKIEKFFTGRNWQMSANNKIQAYIPAGTESLENNLGTAPGIMAKTDGVLIVALPGVPLEMKRMFEESVLPELKSFVSEQALVIRKLRCFGTGESNIAEKLGELLSRKRNPQINCTAEYGVITLHIIAKAKDKTYAEQMADKDEKLLTDLLGKLVFGIGDESLAEVVGQKLAQQNKKITVAESCTGGALARLLTDNSGASGYFTCGWVTYSNQAKVTQLNVDESVIEEYGAVSKEVASAMATGARLIGRTIVGIGITGIAGPTGGTELKPVGLVYIGIDIDGKREVSRYVFAHSRGHIRLRAALTALDMLRLRLQD